MAAFKTAGIIGKQQDDARVVDTIAQLRACLRRHRIESVLELHTARRLGAAAGVPLARLGMVADLVVVVGGDGTFLHAARELAPSSAPLVGINLGRLGFLVDLSPREIDGQFARILDGQFMVETRSLLETTLDASLGMDPLASERPARVERALNDVVIAKWNTIRMIELETSIDGQFVNVQHADGMVIATPTGSTAYALSGGGPLLHPSLDAIVLVPICPHTLSNRPIVVHGTSVIDIRVRHCDPDQARLTCDGQIDIPLHGAAHIRVRLSPHRVRLLHPPDHHHYDLLRAKLGWGGPARTPDRQTVEQRAC